MPLEECQSSDLARVDTNADGPAGLEQRHQATKELRRVRGVVENADAVDVIKGANGKGELTDVRLQEMHVRAPPDVRVCSLHGTTQIDSNYSPAPSSYHVREPAHSAPGIQYQPPLDIGWTKTEFDGKPRFRIVRSEAIQLRTAEEIPLHAEVGGIVIARKAGNIPMDGVSGALTTQRSRPYFSVLSLNDGLLQLK